VDVTSISGVEPFTTKDGSTIRELHHTQAQSLAEARLQPGQATERHYHGRSEEIYFVLEGAGEIELDGERRRRAAARRTGRRSADSTRHVASDHGSGRAALPLLLLAALCARRHVLHLAERR
jgi:MYXO-CTERM domain-containing protein